MRFMLEKKSCTRCDAGTRLVVDKGWTTASTVCTPHDEARTTPPPTTHSVAQNQHTHHPLDAARAFGAAATRGHRIVASTPPASLRVSQNCVGPTAQTGFDVALSYTESQRQARGSTDHSFKVARLIRHAVCNRPGSRPPEVADGKGEHGADEQLPRKGDLDARQPPIGVQVVP